MKRKGISRVIIALSIIFTFVMPLAVVADYGESVNDEPNNFLKTENLDFTHTVFAESATATWCGYCHFSHEALKAIYASGDYPFYYVSLVTDKNSKAYDRVVNDYNVRGFPTVFFDGGYLVDVGGDISNEAQYRSTISACGNRSVPDIDLNLVVAWRGGTDMDIAVSVNNNEINTYNETLRVYITEIESSMEWRDSAGNLYTFPFLDWAFNEEISISAGDTWSDITNWNGSTHGYPNITEDNIVVIASVFNDKWHQGYAYPPSGNPFDAYYVDETNAATPGNGNIPPRKPNTPSGPTTGTENVEYTYSSSTTDPEGNDLLYLFDWGDGTNSGWIGPYHSGDSVDASHTWINEGIYDIKVRAKDTYGALGGWSAIRTVYITTEPMPIIKIGDIHGDLFKIGAVVQNIGSVDAVSTEWSITLTGGIILFGRETSGKIGIIPAGGETTISSDLILGLGNTMVTVTAEKPGISSDTKNQEAFVLLFFIKI